MTTNAQPYQTILEQICNETIAPAAPAVDRDGAFPEESIEALKTAGLLGAMSGPDVGGLGLGLPGAAEIVRQSRSGMRLHRHGSVHALLRRRGSGSSRKRAGAARGGVRRASEHSRLQ